MLNVAGYQEFAPVQSIFPDTKLYTKYQVTATFTAWVMGGIPQHPDVIMHWMQQRIMSDDVALKQMVIKTLQDLEVEVPANATEEELIAAAKQVAEQRNGNTFYRCPEGLCLRAYNVKAMLKEATNIVYPYGAGKANRRGPAKNRAFRSVLIEEVFVDQNQIPLGRMQPDGVHIQIGHVDTPQGKRNTLSYVDYCVQPTITWTMSSMNDHVTKDEWESILVVSQKIGLGAMRGLGHGQFAVTEFSQV